METLRRHGYSAVPLSLNALSARTAALIVSLGFDRRCPQKTRGGSPCSRGFAGVLLSGRSDSLSAWAWTGRSVAADGASLARGFSSRCSASSIPAGAWRLPATNRSGEGRRPLGSLRNSRRQSYAFRKSPSCCGHHSDGTGGARRSRSRILLEDRFGLVKRPSVESSAWTPRNRDARLGVRCRLLTFRFFPRNSNPSASRGIRSSCSGRRIRSKQDVERLPAETLDTAWPGDELRFDD